MSSTTGTGTGEPGDELPGRAGAVSDPPPGEVPADGPDGSGQGADGGDGDPGRAAAGATTSATLTAGIRQASPFQAW